VIFIKQDINYKKDFSHQTDNYLPRKSREIYNSRQIYLDDEPDIR